MFPESENALMSNRSNKTALLEIAALLLVILAGGVLAERFYSIYVGQAGVVLALLVATWFLRRSGQRWRDMGLHGRDPWGKTVAAAIGAWFAILIVINLVVPVIAIPLDMAPQDTGFFSGLRGNWIRFFALTGLVWGTGVFPEEMLARGFLTHRLAEIIPSERWRWRVAIVGQALLFGAGNAYQGAVAFLSTTLVGLVLGLTYLAVGRSLWPVILAHGITQTVNLLAVTMGTLVVE